MPITGPGLLAAGCVFLGIGAPVVLLALQRVSRSITGVNIHAVLLSSKLTVLPAHANFSSLSPTYLAAFMLAMLLVPIVIYRAAKPRAQSRATPVWDGGILAFKPRMQYTATTHANPVRVVFEALYQPHIDLQRASDDPAGRSGPVHYRFTVTPIFERYLYQPVITAVKRLAWLVRPLQSGDVNLYLLYVFVAVIIAYAIYAT
jgi:hydrogenase-4 component B